MDALLRMLAVSLIRKALPTAADRRRPATRPALACDVLEGRQLLAAGLGAAAGLHGRGHGFVPLGEVRGMSWDHRTSADWTNPAPASATPPSTSTTPSSPTDTASTTGVAGAPTGGPGAGQHAALSAQAKADLQTLRADTQAIQAGSGVTTAQNVALRQDLDAIRKDATTAPSQAAQTAFQADLTTLRGTLPTSAQTAQVEADYTTLLTSEGVTDTALISKTIADQVAIASASNVTQAQLDKVAADQKAVDTDLGITTPAPTAGVAMKPGGMPGDAQLVDALTGGDFGEPGGGDFGGPGGGFGRHDGGRFGA